LVCVILKLIKAEEKRMNLGLTERERAVYEFFVFTGGRLKDAAEHFCVSVSTIKSHLKNIYQKLDVHSVSEIVRHYYKNK